MPQPDMMVNIVTPPEVAYQRKQELSVDEIRFELEAWDTLAFDRKLTIENLDHPFAVARGILDIAGGSKSD
jgi:hypothetical protein